MSEYKVRATEGDPREGWFKLMIPEMEKVFGGLFWNDQIKFSPLPFVYGKLDPGQVAFDVQLSIPFLALDRVVLVELPDEDADEDEDEEVSVDAVAEGSMVHFNIKIRPLNLIAMDQQNRCYIPTRFVTCILPVDPHHPLVTYLIAVTTGVVLPQAGEVGKILDLSGRSVDPGQLEG